MTCLTADHDTLGLRATVMENTGWMVGLGLGSECQANMLVVDGLTEETEQWQQQLLQGSQDSRYSLESFPLLISFYPCRKPVR